VSPGIYLIGEDGQLVPMRERPFDSETVLQELLGKYPNLLAGDESDEPTRRWVLVEREAGVASELGGGNRWWIDHLFVDQDGVPTLVEVKRSTDSRIRREVVGQMLDYAANALAYWPIERVQLAFERTCESQGIDPEDALAGVLAGELDEEHFWTSVRTNLQAGHMRLVFVADRIPPELERVVEFLNRNMPSIDVVALEVKQFVGGVQTTLVSRLLGQSAATRQTKSVVRDKRDWDESSFFTRLAEACEPADVEVIRDVLERSRTWFPSLSWGHGKTEGSVYPVLVFGGETYWAYGLWTNGTMQFAFHSLVRRPPFDDQRTRDEFRRRLNEVNGIELDASAIDKMPSIQVALLRDLVQRQRFYDALQWFTETVRGSTNTDPSAGAQLAAGGPARVPSLDETPVDAGAPEPNTR
jgi:hypothetical protein